MRAIESEQTIFVDVDDTIILHDLDAYPTLPKVLVYDPYSGFSQKVAVHVPHVRLLQERAKRGAYIVVWSAGGWQWAKAVVCALGLQDVVQQCMSKPVAVIDDLPIEAAVGTTMYLKPNSKWKTAANGP